MAKNKSQKHRIKETTPGFDAHEERSDIPYAMRLQLKKAARIGSEREDAAATSAKLALVAMNDVMHVGFQRGCEFAKRYMELDAEYYADREIEEVHLQERLKKMGYVVDERGRIHAVMDAEGKFINAKDVDKHEGLQEHIDGIARWGERSKIGGK